MISLLGMNKIRKTAAALDCSTVSSGEFIKIDYACMSSAPIMADKENLEFVEISQNIMDADSNDENEMSNVAPVPTSSEMRNIVKIMRSYLDAHSIGKINNKMDNIEQFVDILMLKEMQRKNSRLFFLKTQ
ncbi:hypothetical protein TNCV_674421 [Trichonephila clavipes]|nr:hypothetical protein TNCV_674421 [Trichonephila clavipes]